MKLYMHLEFVFNDSDFNRGKVPHLLIVLMGDVVFVCIVFQ